MNPYEIIWEMEEEYEDSFKSPEEQENGDSLYLLVPDDFGDKD